MGVEPLSDEIFRNENEWPASSLPPLTIKRGIFRDHVTGSRLHAVV